MDFTTFTLLRNDDIDKYICISEDFLQFMEMHYLLFAWTVDASGIFITILYYHLMASCHAIFVHGSGEGKFRIEIYVFNGVYFPIIRFVDDSGNQRRATRRIANNNNWQLTYISYIHVFVQCSATGATKAKIEIKCLQVCNLHDAWQTKTCQHSTWNAICIHAAYVV